MNPIPHPSQPAAPSIQTRQQLDVVVENIIQLQLDRAELERAQEREITAVRQKFRPPLAELDRYLAAETTWVETWARENPGAFGEKRSFDCTHAIIGFRVTPPRIERASRKWTWSAVALKLADLGWGKRYLRVPAPEVNKEAILADRAELSAVELRQAGLRISQEERFFIAPHDGAESVSPLETDWQEAA
jgi:phage host-nuclease inhibitor protein Gam